jgi:electron transfer flavoprotein alpha subunit
LIVSNSLTLYYTYHTMLLRQPLRIARTARLSLAQRRLASSLVFLEHKGGKLNDSSLHAVTAAQKVDGEVRGYSAWLSAR